MEAKKGLLAILVIVCACACLAVGAAIIGWNAFGRDVAAGADSFMESIPYNTIEIDRENLERYLLENGIMCRKDASASMGDYDAYVCDASDIPAEINFRITYSKKDDKPFSIILGITNMDDIADHDDVMTVLGAAAGIPYRGADAVKAREWLNGCLHIGAYDELMVAKTIAAVTFRIYHTKGSGFTLSIMGNMS